MLTHECFLYFALICPSPSMSHLYVVISSSAIGPRAPSFCVLMPISAPSPNCAPSVKLVGAFQYTQAALALEGTGGAFVIGDDALAVSGTVEVDVL